MEYCTIPGIMALVLALILGRVSQSDEQTTDTTAFLEPCTISTEQAGIVTVRVGPGTHRGVLQFLPANETLSVIGQATDEGGAIWWKIELPGVVEAWVAADDVEEMGGCEVVGDADAPPVVLPPISDTPAGEGTVYFPVYNCVYLGDGVFEWYSADVTYDESGAIINVTILEGPFTGEFQPTCPPGDGGGGDGGGGDPTAEPPSDPTATPSASSSSSSSFSGGGDD